MTVSFPDPAARAIAAGVSRVPAERMATPSGRSSPAFRIAVPARIASWMSTAAGSGPDASRPRVPTGVPPASAGVVSSTWTTASAADGIGAPVAIRIAVPRLTSVSGAFPARTSPMTSRRTGAASVAEATSAARTA